MIRYWLACARWAVQRVGYWIRPYDMLADRRRWFWRPRQRCGWPYELLPSLGPVGADGKEG